MVSAADIGPISQQYAAAASVPLIKSPSLWLPKPVELPNDIHPLPEDITAYFVYPFSLEEHVLSLHPSPHDAISQRRARNAEVLHQREVEEEQRERDAIKRIAPGYNPSSMLIPKSSSHTPSSSMSGAGVLGDLASLHGSAAAAGASPAGGSSAAPGGGVNAGGVTGGTVDAMDDLVAKLEEMEARK
ncbi:hypothetical protein IAT38_006589 [Cryptococcus sp. DSM 104549]